MSLRMIVFAGLLVLISTNVSAQSEEMAKQAMKAYEEKDYAACANLFLDSFNATSQFFKDDQAMQVDHYNAACCLALAGRETEAMSYLEKAINNPYFWDLKHLKEDPDLIGLHDTAPWSAVLAKAESNMATRQPMTGASLDIEWARKHMPKVPREVSRARGHGMVLLVVTVDSNGLPKKILIGQSSGDDLLDGAAAEAAKRWRYYPWVTKNGIKFSGLVRIPVNFTLDRKFMIEFRH